MQRSVVFCCILCFFFNDTAPTEIYTLSLHDALPIYASTVPSSTLTTSSGPSPTDPSPRCSRSEEHTSELQSQFPLVCRLLLAKKKKNISKELRVLHAREHLGTRWARTSI